MKSSSPSVTKVTRVLIADDHPVVREGLVTILKSEKDIKVVAEAADGKKTCELYNELAPDVFLLDLRMPDEYNDAEREAVVQAHPRTAHFKEDIIQAFYDGIKHRPESTFGNVKADVLADKDPTFKRINFCSVIRGSAWPA